MFFFHNVLQSLFASFVRIYEIKLPLVDLGLPMGVGEGGRGTMASMDFHTLFKNSPKFQKFPKMTL